MIVWQRQHNGLRYTRRWWDITMPTTTVFHMIVPHMMETHVTTFNMTMSKWRHLSWYDHVTTPHKRGKDCMTVAAITPPHLSTPITITLSHSNTFHDATPDTLYDKAFGLVTLSFMVALCYFPSCFILKFTLFSRLQWTLSDVLY